MVNDTLGREIFCKWGLRQGDPPISIIVANMINHMIAKYREEGIISGLGYWDDTNVVINLHYVDDTLIFGRECLPQAMIIKWILFCYEKWSGLESISTKAPWSSWGRYRNVVSSCPSFLTALFGECLSPILDFLLWQENLRRSNGHRSLKRYKKRLAGWKEKLLSLGGRITMINTILSAIPTISFPFSRVQDGWKGRLIL